MASAFTVANDEFSDNWTSTHNTESQRLASLGDPQRFNDEALNPITHAHDALKDGLKTLRNLVADPTRTEVSKHAVAKKVADRVVGTIETSAASIAATARSLNNRAAAVVEDVLAIDPNRVSIHSEIRGYIRETAKVEGGIGTIRKAMVDNLEVASVLYQSPNFLLGLPDEVRMNLVAEGIEKHAPKAGRFLADADALSALAIKYGHVAKAVPRAFYNNALADQAKLRVEVD